MAVVIGLWPVHVVVMFRTIARTKQLGIVLKTLVILLLPIPLLLWPFVAAVGSFLVGFGYGVGQPLVATFEAVGDGRKSKFYHAFVDGTWSTVKGACTWVRDFFDFVYHSIFDSLDEFRLGEPKNGKPTEITLHELPLCALVGLLGVLVDTPAITIVAFCKMPIMLIKGWRRLLGDLVTRHGPCMEAACVPFAGLALVFWPFVVVASALTALICSPILGLYSAVVVYQEMSYKCGLNYIVAIVAEFDEYSNDVLHAHEGSCLPRPKYRKTSKDDLLDGNLDIENSRERKHVPEIPQLNTQKSFRHTLQEVKLVQIMDSIFQAMETNGKNLLSVGALKQSDVDGALKGNKASGKIVVAGLPAYCNLLALVRSAKSNSTGILLFDGTEVTMSNKPSDRLSDWFFEPLLTIKDQVRAAHLQESEERYLEKLCLMLGDTQRMESWENGGVEPEDGLRRGELQALARRLQGISNSISRLPTHRRRLEAVMKNLQTYAAEMGRNSNRQKDLQDKNKSIKKSRSFNFRALMKEGSNRFNPTVVAATDRSEDPKEITPNADQVV
ncbi:hypothetical protein M758_1G262900 [Ceratodon purpureus]|nr:hypothetical protein M758_1G262900 [Ceratodon purpureus]